MSTAAAPSTVLITGAASGIGRQLALLLAAQGRPIAAVDLHAEPLKTLEAELQAQNRRCAWAVADVTDSAALTATVRDLETNLGPTELLIASAGVGVETSPLNFDPTASPTLVPVSLTAAPQRPAPTR